MTQPTGPTNYTDYACVLSNRLYHKRRMFQVFRRG